MKEMCRTHISMENECGCCWPVRSKVAQEQGLTEEQVMALPSFEKTETFDDRELAALRYAPPFKRANMRPTGTRYMTI
tara:strand:- start:92 stop:325 length:234 start_codon:yes stop_codon:yes gene_type:complete